MLLTVSKRLEFSASRRLYIPGASDAENRRLFGAETAARYGTGRNYVAWFVFTGAVEPETGMLMNISEIKQRAGRIIDDAYDHKFLNADNSAFSSTVPTARNVARQLFQDVAPLFADTDATLTAVHLAETAGCSATAFASGNAEEHHAFRFSAARRTISPRLSEEENRALFGQAASEHGHEYRVRITLRPDSPAAMIPMAEIHACIESLHDELDHRNLNVEVPALRDRPMTTEVLSHHVFRRAAASLPVHRVRIHERADFFAECIGETQFLLGMEMPFSAAHRLHSRHRSADENVAIFDKCNNPRGHGHTYVAEAAVAGQLDERTGTVWSFDHFRRAMEETLAPWQDRHLDLETEEFRDRPSTGENIVQVLWDRLTPHLEKPLERLRLWETANNRFTLRQSPP